MLCIREAREPARALRIEARLLLHEEFQRQTLRSTYLSPRLREIVLRGGTALRMIYGSPRFSLDLDFKLAELEKEFKVKVELLEKEFTGGIRKGIRVEHPVPTIVYVETKEISDILVDKVCAIAGKSYALPRNVYDVDFIVRNGGKLNREHLEEEFGEWRETKGGLKRAIALLEKADHKSIMKEINMLLPEGAKVNLEDTSRSVRTTSGLLEEAVEALDG